MSQPAGPGPTTRPEIAAELYLRTLSEGGVDALYAVAGTDFPSVIEAYEKAGSSGALPRPYTVPHENLAVSMAHGDALRTGRAQVAMVHVSVGTANMVCGALNAVRDGVPLVLSAGRTPLTEEGEHGTRTRFIHWAQEMFDQGGMIREAVKWDYELRSAGQAGDVAIRALDIAEAPPPGPVYLSLPRELLAREVPPDLPRRKRTRLAEGRPDPDAIDRLAERIAAASLPVIVTSNSGREPGALAALSDLVEAWSIPVVQFNPRSVNLPFEHPMCIGFDPQSLLPAADLIVSLACDVPYVPAVTTPRPTAEMWEIDRDPLFSRYPLRSFGAAQSIVASPRAALSALRAALGEPAGDRARRVADRTAQVAALRARRMDRAAIDRGRFTAASASAILAERLPREAVVVNEYSFRTDLAPFDREGQFYGFTPAGGLGFGMGAALGIAAADARAGLRDRPVVAMLGDGAYMFNNPVACHWASAAHGLPILSVIFNNRRWGAVRNSTLAMYPQGAAAASDGMFLADLSPAPDYAAICRAHGGIGETVRSGEALPAAIDRALTALAGGQQVLIDLVIES
ncbi:thiamine pyrophosphate-requiring protein [Oceaniglobus roseus]|uniref:thiamine pyrophosphate-requiring protein n=1 Tax=Oceaniglobus roseus TaxID=1737570 RepID=UPI000C7F3932|nr:thiamine pyrophosphate-requiring protein [Kandeliimicrobium roseum]